HQLRQPGRHRRPHPVGHLRRDPTLVRTRVHRLQTHRRGTRGRAHRLPLPPTRPGAHMTDQIPEVLFVCVHNTGRSQMAPALLAHPAHGRARVRSAGTAPASEINPAVVTVLAELGLDVTKEFPKPLTDDAARSADVVITMGCGDTCPYFPGTIYLDWQL